MTKTIPAPHGYEIHLRFIFTDLVQVWAKRPTEFGADILVSRGWWQGNANWPLSKIPQAIAKALMMIEKDYATRQSFLEQVEQATEYASLVVEVHREIEG